MCAPPCVAALVTKSEPLNMQRNAPAASHMLQMCPPPVCKYGSTYLPRPHILSLVERVYPLHVLFHTMHSPNVPHLLLNQNQASPELHSVRHVGSLGNETNTLQWSWLSAWRKSKGLHLKVGSWRATKFLVVNMAFATPHILVLLVKKNYPQRAKK